MKTKHIYIIALAAILIIAGLSGCGVAVIEDGETGVKADFGKIKDQQLGTGWHIYFPLFTWIEVWNVKTQEIKETASVPSAEGLIAQLDVSVLFNVPKDKAVLIRKTIGSNFAQTVLEPYVRESIRNVVSGYSVKALYSVEGRSEIGQKILDFLKNKLEARGVLIQDVLLRDVRLPAVFSQSIEVKLKTEQEALQKEFELQKAKKDAEIAVTRAEGVAKSNRIIGDSINENYLRYRWIEGLQSNEKQVVYVPTEANLPIMEASRWSSSNFEKQKQS